VAPGTSPGRLSVDGDYLQSAEGSLEAEVAGAAAGTGYDQLSVSGAASLGGTLNIVTAAGFSPPFGSVYDVLVAGTLSGGFDAIAGAELADRAYGVVQDPAAGRVRLSVAAGPPAPPEGGAPSIPGTAQSGDTVACNPGGWTGEPTSFEYQWLRNGAAITGATSAGYTLTADDVEQTIQCQVVAINEGGRSDPALSNELVPTAPPPIEAPTNVGLPTVTGTPVRGQTLRCAPGIWTGAPVLTYQWLLDGAATGRTDSSYLVRRRDVGHMLACRVTARNAAGTVSATSVGVQATLTSR